MKKEKITIDLQKLDGRVFVGRSNGQLARKYFKLDSCSEDNCSIEFVIPEDTISVNSSFFLGLFGTDVQRIGDFESFFNYVDISKVNPRFKEQLEVAVKRSLSRSGYGL